MQEPKSHMMPDVQDAQLPRPGNSSFILQFTASGFELFTVILSKHLS